MEIIKKEIAMLLILGFIPGLILGSFIPKSEPEKLDLWFVCDNVWAKGNRSIALYVEGTERELAMRLLEINRLERLSECYREYRFPE